MLLRFGSLRRIDYAHTHGGPARCQQNLMLLVAKVLQAAGMAYLGISWVIGLPDPPRGRDLAIGGALFLLGWALLRGKGGEE